MYTTLYASWGDVIAIKDIVIQRGQCTFAVTVRSSYLVLDKDRCLLLAARRAGNNNATPRDLDILGCLLQSRIVEGVLATHMDQTPLGESLRSGLGELATGEVGADYLLNNVNRKNQSTEHIYEQRSSRNNH